MIIYFDTETTSLAPGQICQLAYVIEDRNSIATKNFFFEVDSIDEAASKITGFTVEKLKKLSGSKKFSESIQEISHDFENSNLIVAHNFAFDYAFMQEEFSRCNQIFKYKESICSMKYFTPILKLQKKDGGFKYPKLKELMDYYNIQDCDVQSSQTFHDARFDAYALYLSIKAAKTQNFIVSMDFKK